MDDSFRPATLRFRRGATWTGIVLAIVVALLPRGRDRGVVWGQSTDRPRLYLETQGPAGLVRKLAFSTDSPTTALYAAGEDKTVHVWHLSDSSAKAGKVATFVKTMRWEFSRGPRGAIYDLDVARSGKFPLLAIGGYGAREGLNAAAFNLDRGELAPHFSGFIDGASLAVDAVSFSPDGSRLAVVDKGRDFGRVQVWTAPQNFGFQDPWPLPTKTPLVDFRGTDFNPEVVLKARFLSNRWLAIPDFPTRPQTKVPARETRILLYDMRSPKPSDSPTILNLGHSHRVTALAASPDGSRWASADSFGEILVWSHPRENPIVQKPTSRVVRRGFAKQRVAASMAFSPDGGRLVVANVLDVNDQTVAEFWDVSGSGSKLVDQHQLSGKEEAFVHLPSVAWSVDGRWIASYRPAAQTIELFDATLPSAEILRRPRETIQGRGAPIHHVSFESDRDSKIVGFSSNSTDAERQVRIRAFDLASGKLLADPQALAGSSWRMHESDSGEWSHVPEDGRQSALFRIRHADGKRSGSVTLDPTIHGTYRSHAWIAGPDGEPAAVAVGTKFGNGIYVYRLPKGSDEKLTLLRNFRDHNGAVNSMCVSADRRLLASASEDQTVKIWSLDGLLDGRPQRAGWGADVVKEADGKVRLRKLIPAGILAARGFQEGDELAALKLGAKLEERNADRILERFPKDRLELGQVTILGRRGVKDFDSAVSVYPGWEPLATLFVDRERPEWALFSAEGYYASSDFEGGDLFGWQSNDGERNPPRTLKAVSLRNRLERPDFMRSLFTGERPAVPAGLLSDAVRSVPLISPIDPRLLEAFPDKVTPKIEAQIRLPPGANWNDYRATVSVNEAEIDPKFIQASPVEGADGRQTVYLSLKEDTPRDALRRQPGLSHVNFHVENAPGTQRSSPISVEVKTAFRDADAGEAGRPYPLYFLGVGANGYQGVSAARQGGTGWDPLRFAEKDARDLADRLRKISGRQPRQFDLTAENVQTLLGPEVTRSKVIAAVDRLTRSVRASNDAQALVVVFLSGHGDVKKDEDEFYFVTPECRDTLDLNAKAVRWSDFEPLMTLPCQKLFVIDACRSGTIGSLKGTIHAMKRHACMFITSATSEANSFEDPTLENGLFTHALLRGLQGLPTADFPKPPQKFLPTSDHVTLGNLYQFLVESVQERAKKLGQKQVPYGFPDAQLRFNQRRLFLPASTSP